MHAIAALKIVGLVSVASYALAKLAFAVGWLGWYRQHVVAIARRDLPVMPRGYAVRALAAADLAGHAIDADPAVQAERFAQGLTCLGVFTPKGVLAGVVWLGTGTGREGNIALDFALPAQGCWDTGMWIHPDFRLGRAFSALWAGVATWMEARGLTHSYSVIVDYNVGSLTAHRRLGMVEMARLLVIRVGRWQWIARGEDRWRLAERQRPLAWALPAVGAG